MKLKLDENLGTRAQKLFAAAGHDVQSVAAEGLSGAADPEVYQVSRREGRCLVTLDLDFADVTRFPPAQCPGIVVIRLPRNPTPALLDSAVEQFLAVVSFQPLEKRLWVMEPGRLRIHQTEE